MPDKSELMAQCVSRISGDLVDARGSGAKNPILRRKLSTISGQCGRKRALYSFLEDLRGRLRRNGVFTKPSLIDPGLRSGDWVQFSLSPFPPEPHLFAREEDLRRLIVACLGHGVFRNLVPFKSPGNPSGLEYVLPDKKRIDLLCQERTKSGYGALVAFELKRGTPDGTIEQLIRYMDALKDLFPERNVRGIIVSSREDPVASSLLKKAIGYDIEWFCYRVEFEQIDGE